MPRCPHVIVALLLTVTMPAFGQQVASLEPSADGRELLDKDAGLAWSRCVEGMHWSGRHCEGEPTRATHKEALALARARSEAQGQRWRLPRVQELKRLGERVNHAPNASELTPDAPRGWYWSATARIQTEAINPYSYGNVQKGATERQVDSLAPQTGWAVEQPAGSVHDRPKHNKLLVRLVRGVPP